MSDWDDLRIFLAVARQGSVTAAATELGVNHSTVSRRIQAFERKHSIRLFERLPSGYAMTQAAENIYQQAVAMEAHAHNIDRALFGQDDRLRGRLCVTASSYLAHEIIMPRLGDFCARYPGIELSLLVTKTLQNMAARQADIAVRLTPQPPENLIGRQVAQLHQGIYAAKQYLDDPPVQHAIVLWGDDAGHPAWAVHHFPDARIALRVDGIDSVRAAVKSGLGIAQLPCCIGDADPGLFRLAIELPPPTWGVWVLSHVDLRASARVRVCREFLIDLLTQHRSVFAGDNSRYIAIEQ